MIKFVLTDETCTFKFDKDYGSEFDDFEERYPWIKEVEKNFLIGPKMGKFTLFPLNNISYVFLHCVEDGKVNIEQENKAKLMYREYINIINILNNTR